MRSLVSYRTALRSGEEVLLRIVTRRNGHQDARALMRNVMTSAAAGHVIGETIELCDTQIYGEFSDKILRINKHFSFIQHELHDTQTYGEL